MNDFIFYLRLGFEHILDINAYDHLLFLVAMSLPFVFKQLRLLLLLVTAFTVGHSPVSLGRIGWYYPFFFQLD
jgi:hypothetical protein